MFAHPREVGTSLRFPVKQVIQQGQRHLLRGATIGMDVKQITVGERERKSLLEIEIQEPQQVFVFMKMKAVAYSLCFFKK